MRGSFSLHQQPDPLVLDPAWAGVRYYSRYESGIKEDLSGTTTVPNTNGTITQDSAQAKFGTYSLNHQPNSYIELAASNSPNSYYFGTDDWTVEFWMYLVSVGNPGSNNNNTVFAFSASQGIYFGWDTTGKHYLGVNDGTNKATNTNPNSTFQPGVWNHFAVCKSGTAMYTAINGWIQVFTSTNNSIAAFNVLIGSQAVSFTQSNYTAYFDDFRITRGIARYTANFVPPTKAFPTPTSLP